MRLKAIRGAAGALGVAVLVLSACGGGGAPGAQDGGGDRLQSCTIDEECPLGQVCSLGYCVSAGADAAVDQAGPARMSVTPQLLDFGNPYLGGEYQRSFTIANVGGATLNITGLNLIEDRTVGAFTMTALDTPTALAPGEDRTLVVTLRPNDASIPTGSVKVHSDDPDNATRDVTIDLVSHSKGSAALGVCAINPSPPPDCVVSGDGNPVVDYGVVPYGAVVERVVALTNVGDGNLPVGVTEISLTDPAHFTVTLRQVVDDPANPGQRIEQPATLPMLLSTGDPAGSPPVPPTELRVHLAFDATGIDGDVPHVSLVVKDALSAQPTTVPIIGHIAGCKPTGDAGVPDGGVDIQTDPFNCGSCGHVCTTAHGTPACANGQCATGSCDANWGDCNSLPGDGCETDLRTTTAHCGSCGIACVNPNGSTQCLAGTCVPSCAAGSRDCDGNPVNGCEADISGSIAHCGDCTTVCRNDHGSTACVLGQCSPSCGGGFASCDGNVVNGCETPTTTLTDCGGCSQPCSRSNATATCATGACAIATCSGGYGNCNNQDADGCEQQLNTLTHCGSCNTACARANATATCATGACAISSCNGGYGNCDNQDANGCEQQLNTLTHCGGCNTPCARNNATATCATGSCAISSCNGGYGNCDGQDANGCEQQLNTLSHCSACNTPCSRANATATCATGSCAISSCNSGYQNCDGNDANGCELSRDANPVCASSIIYLGTIDGDTGSGTVSASGNGEAWYRVTIREGNNGIVYLSAQVDLTSAAGVDFDLYVYCVSCGGTLLGSSSNGAGATDTVFFRRDDTWGSDDGRDLIIEVRYWNATSCGGWSLNVYGNVATSSGGSC